MYNDIPISKRHMRRADRCKVLVCSSRNKTGSGSALLSLQHNPRSSRALTIAQAEMQKLGMRGAGLTVQEVARDMTLAARPGQIII